MSSTNKTTNYQLSQFVGTDIPSILNDYNGDMRKIDSAIHDATVAGGDNASAIAELQSTVGRHTTEIGGLTSNVNTLSGRVINIESKIPDSASVENPLITEKDLENAKGRVIFTIEANTYNNESDWINAVKHAIDESGIDFQDDYYDGEAGRLALQVGPNFYRCDSKYRFSMNSACVINNTTAGKVASTSKVFLDVLRLFDDGENRGAIMTLSYGVNLTSGATDGNAYITANAHTRHTMLIVS